MKSPQAKMETVCFSKAEFEQRLAGTAEHFFQKGRKKAFMWGFIIGLVLDGVITFIVWAACR